MSTMPEVVAASQAEQESEALGSVPGPPYLLRIGVWFSLPTRLLLKSWSLVSSWLVAPVTAPAASAATDPPKSVSTQSVPQAAPDAGTRQQATKAPSLMPSTAPHMSAPFPMEQALLAIAEHVSSHRQAAITGAGIAGLSKTPPSTLYATAVASSSFMYAAGVIKAAVVPGATVQQATSQITAALRPLLRIYAQQCACTLAQAHMTFIPDLSAAAAHGLSPSAHPGNPGAPSPAAGAPPASAFAAHAAPSPTLTVAFQATLVVPAGAYAPAPPAYHPVYAALLVPSPQRPAAASGPSTGLGSPQTAAPRDRPYRSLGGDTGPLLSYPAPREERGQPLSEVGLHGRSVSGPWHTLLMSTSDAAAQAAAAASASVSFGGSSYHSPAPSPSFTPFTTVGPSAAVAAGQPLADPHPAGSPQDMSMFIRLRGGSQQMDTAMLMGPLVEVHAHLQVEHEQETVTGAGVHRERVRTTTAVSAAFAAPIQQVPTGPFLPPAADLGPSGPPQPTWPTGASLRSHLLTSLPHLAPNACVLVVSVRLTGACAPPAHRLVGIPAHAPVGNPSGFGMQAPHQQHTPLQSRAMGASSPSVRGAGPAAAESAVRSSIPALLQTGGFVRMPDEPGGRYSPPAAPTPPDPAPPTPSSRSSSSSPPGSKDGSEEGDANDEGRAGSGSRAQDMHEQGNEQHVTQAVMPPSAGPATVSQQTGSIPGQVPGEILMPSPAAVSGPAVPVEDMPAVSHAFYLHPPAVALSPATSADATQRSSTTPTAPPTHPGTAGEEVLLYSDTQAVQEEVRAALAAAGLPAELQAQVTQLRVVVLEGETGALVSSDTVPLDETASGARLSAPTCSISGLLRYLILAVLPSTQPHEAAGSPQQPARESATSTAPPGRQEATARDQPSLVLLASLPLVLLPHAAAAEVVWLFKAMVKEQAEQVGIPVSEGFVEDEPCLGGVPAASRVATAGEIEPVGAMGEAAEQPGDAAAMALAPTSTTPAFTESQAQQAADQQEITATEIRYLCEAHTAPIPAAAVPAATSQLPTGVWVQRQSAPLDAVAGPSTASATASKWTTRGTAAPPVPQRHVWGGTSTAGGLQRVVEEGNGAQHAGRSAGPPSSRRALMAAAAMRELMVVTRASVDSSRASGSRPSSIEQQQSRMSAESAASAVMGEADVGAVAQAVPYLYPTAGTAVPPEQHDSAAVQREPGDGAREQHGEEGQARSTVAALVPAAGGSPVEELPAAAHWLTTVPMPLLTFVFNHHLSMFLRDISMVLKPPLAALMASQAAAVEQDGSSTAAGSGQASVRESAGSGGGLAAEENGSTPGAAAAAAAARGCSDMQTTLVPIARELLLFLTRHCMLACFKEVALALTSPASGPLLHLKLGRRSLSAGEAAELLAAAHQDPSVGEQLLLSAETTTDAPAHLAPHRDAGRGVPQTRNVGGVQEGPRHAGGAERGATAALVQLMQVLAMPGRTTAEVLRWLVGCLISCLRQLWQTVCHMVRSLVIAMHAPVP